MAERWEEEVDELLRGLRDDVPEMDAHAFAAGRARLLAHVGAPQVAESSPEDDPVVRVLPADSRRRSPPLRRAAPWLAVAAAVVVVAAGAVVLLPGGGTPGGAPAVPPTTSAGGSQTRPAPSVTGRPGAPLPTMPAEPLNTAGELAGKAADFPVRPGEVHYVGMSRSQAANANSPGGTALDELWIPYDRDGEWMQRRAADGEVQGGDNSESRAKGGVFEGGDYPSAVRPDDAATMPRDTAALYEDLRTYVHKRLPPGAGSSMTETQEAVLRVFEMLADTTGTLPADLRAALLRTLGYLPDVTVTSDASASDGRPAVVLSHVLEDSTYRNEILLDPETARMVEWRNISLKASSGFPPGKQFSSELVTEAVVSELGRLP
jgi:hypothetical protein